MQYYSRRDHERHPFPDIDLREMHREIREGFSSRMREVLDAEFIEKSVAIFQGGRQLNRYDTDKEELFRQESFFNYLFGVKESGFWGLIVPKTGRSILFCPRLDPVWAIWDGKIYPPSHFQEVYGVDEVHYVDEIPDFFEKQFGHDCVVHVLSGKNSDSGLPFEEPNLSSIGLSKTIERSILLSQLSECRVLKTKTELQLLRYVNQVASAAHRYVMRNCKPGMYEYQLESLFLHYCSYHMHARYVPYSCICCTGENGAVLHYGGGSSPLDRILEDGDMCLLDMGTEHHCYVSDITCSYPANGKFTKEQADIYQVVLKAQKAVEAEIKPGAEWVSLHLLAEKVILDGLRQLGFLVGSIEEMHEKRISALFMPHGLGHLMGLDVHDVGGFIKGRERIQKPGLRSLRMNRPLEAGMVVTNEPGVYFIDSLLRPALSNPDLNQYLNEGIIVKFLDMKFGGIRLEDDVIVTENGCEVMTRVPRTIEEIEKQMSLPASEEPIADEL